ncbi:MAG TPA: glycoside hydrolase family 97 N-terminal domain-containing protein, partial [Bacteroidales bacterium]
MKKYFLLFVSALLIFSSTALSKDYQVSSPDGNVKVQVSIDKETRFQVLFKNKLVISSSPISMSLQDGLVLGNNSVVKKNKIQFYSNIEKPVLPRKYASILNEYNELEIEFKGGYCLIFRAYNDGAAYRWKTALKDTIVVKNELVSFNFPENAMAWFPEEESMFSHQERLYIQTNLSEINPERFCSTGMLVEMKDKTKVFISESDLEDCPGMYLHGIA